MSMMATHWSVGFPQQVFLYEEHGWWYAKVGSKELKYLSYDAFLLDWDLIITY